MMMKDTTEQNLRAVAKAARTYIDLEQYGKETFTAGEAMDMDELKDWGADCAEAEQHLIQALGIFELGD